MLTNLDWQSAVPWIWMACLCASPLIYSLWLIARSTYSPWECILFLPTYTICRLLWRVQVEGEFPVGPKQGAILVANHRSSIDPFFLQMLPGRRVHWMVAKEYCQHWLIGKPLRAYQVIPTNRGGVDTGSTKMAIRLTQQGGLVGMFPEGRLNKTALPLVSLRPGAALVALRAKVPLIPCYIEGSPYGGSVLDPLFTPARVRVRYGTPVWPESAAPVDSSNASPPDSTGNCSTVHSEEQEPANDQQRKAQRFIVRAMQQVLDLAGRPDLHPELAGKKWVE